jgi:hypothetical protein
MHPFTGFGQSQRAIDAGEQGRAELLLERLDFLADGGLREAELAGGVGEAQVARRRVEAAQQIERQARRPLTLH